MTVRSQQRARLAALLALVLGLSLGIVLVPTSSPAAAAPPVSPMPVDGSWLEQVNWWRSFGSDLDGNPIPAVTNPPGLNQGPQNHVDYLQSVRDQGGPSQCTHYGIAGYPRDPALNYWHNVLSCGLGLPDAFTLWVRTPFHGEPVLDPTVTTMGAAESADRSNAAAVMNSSKQRPDRIYTWPGNGKTLPRRSFPGNESPDPISMCPGPANGYGQPLHVWFPTNRTRVSSSVTSQAGDTVEHCVFGGPSAFTFFPRQVWAPGTSYTASITTTATDGTDPQTTTFTFHAATTASAGGTVNDGVDRITGTITPSTDAEASGYPVLEYRLVGSMNSRLVPDWNHRLPASTTTFDIPAPPGSWTICVQARTALGWGECTFIGWPEVTSAGFTFNVPWTVVYGSSAPVSASVTDGSVIVENMTPEYCTLTGDPSTGYTMTALSSYTCYLRAVEQGGQNRVQIEKIQMSRAKLTVTADNQVRQVGQPNPTLTATYSGFVNGDDATSARLTGAPVCTTTATADSPAGAYPITCTTTGLWATYYSFVTAPGSLLVTDGPVAGGTRPQTVTVTPPTARVSYGDLFTASVSTESGLPATLSTSTPTVCQVQDGQVTAVDVGTCTIVAHQGGDDTWAAGLGTVSLTIAKADLSVYALDASRSTTDPDPQYQYRLSGFKLGETEATSDIGAPVSCTSPGDGSTTSGMYHVRCGTQLDSRHYRITMSGWGTLLVAPGLPTTGITGHTSQTISTPYVYPRIGTATALPYTVDSDLPLSFGSMTPEICTVDGDQVTGIAKGLCRLAVVQAGDATRAPAVLVRDLHVSGQAQSVTFHLPTGLQAGASAELSATASSGLPVTFTSLTPTVCTVSGSTLTAVATGWCGVQATQAGDDTWDTSSAIYYGAVTAPPNAQTVTWSATTPTSVAHGDSATLSAIASSGLPVTYTTDTPAVCAVTGNTLVTRTAGDCTVTARQAGSGTWAPATAEHRVTITKRPLTVTAADATRVAGRTNPTFQWSLTGQGGLAVPGAPVCTTTATADSPAGTYPISCAVGTLPTTDFNYTFKPGTLTITAPAPQPDLDPQPEPEPASPNAPFVRAAYQDFLGRQPTNDELTADATALDNGSLTRQAFLHRMATSDEWVHVIVTDFYRDTLNRDPEPAGLTGWSALITSGQRTVPQVAAGFYGSAEYHRNAGGTDAAWITALYTQVLGRNPSAADIDFWTRHTANVGHGNVAYEIYQSQESRNKRVTDLYQALLHRAPDPNGMAFWPRHLTAVGDIELAKTLADSTEYANQANLRYPNP